MTYSPRQLAAHNERLALYRWLDGCAARGVKVSGPDKAEIDATYCREYGLPPAITATEGSAA